jgi:hypothetical protein
MVIQLFYSNISIKNKFFLFLYKKFLKNKFVFVNEKQCLLSLKNQRNLKYLNRLKQGSFSSTFGLIFVGPSSGFQTLPQFPNFLQPPVTYDPRNHIRSNKGIIAASSTQSYLTSNKQTEKATNQLVQKYF